MALAGTRGTAPFARLGVSAHAHCTEGLTRSKGRERADGDGNRVGSGNGDGIGDGAGTGPEVKARG